MVEFEQWFVDQDFYTNMLIIYGDRLFNKDGDVYRVLPVQMAYEAWSEKQFEINRLRKLLEIKSRFLSDADGAVKALNGDLEGKDRQIANLKKELGAIKALLRMRSVVMRSMASEIVNQKIKASILKHLNKYKVQQGYEL